MSDNDSIFTTNESKPKAEPLQRMFNFGNAERESQMSSISDFFASDDEDDERLNAIRPNNLLNKAKQPSPPSITGDSVSEFSTTDDSMKTGAIGMDEANTRMSTFSDIINFEDHPDEALANTHILHKLTKPTPMIPSEAELEPRNASSLLSFGYSNISSVLEPIKKRSKPRKERERKKSTKNDSNGRPRREKEETLNRNRSNRRPSRKDRLDSPHPTVNRNRTEDRTLDHKSKPLPKIETLERGKSHRRKDRTADRTIDRKKKIPKPTKNKKLVTESNNRGTLTLGRQKNFKALTASEKLWFKFITYFFNDSSRFMVLIVYFGAITTVFMLKFNQYTDNQGIKDIFGPFLGISKGSAAVIKLNSSLILLTMCRTLLTKLRASVLSSVIAFDRSTVFHKLLGLSTILFAILHTVAHTFNFLFIYGNLNIDPQVLLTTSIPGITGLVLNVVFFLAGTASFKNVRMAHFELFYYSHWLWAVFYAVTIPHSMTCFVGKMLGQQNQCIPGGDFWIWAAVGLVTYFIERGVLRLKRGISPVKIISIVKRPSNVLEVSLDCGKEIAYNASAGMYIFLNCPSISYFQYHPFTLSSAPSECIFTVHIRCTGEWTMAFAKKCGVDFEKGKDVKPAKLPLVYIDGPFGTSSNDVFDYKIAVLVGAGIGITPFSSILKELYLRKRENRAQFEKIYLFWICRDPDSFEWFIDVLKQIEDCDEIEPYIYLTGQFGDFKEIRTLALEENNNDFKIDALTGLKTPTFYGRPHWATIFDEITVEHPKTDVGVFTCAPERLCSELMELSSAYTLKNERGTVIHFHKENF